MKPFILSAILATLALPSFADPNDACGMDRGDWYAAHGNELDGFWTVANGVGILRMGGRTMQLPPNPEETVVGITVSDSGIEIGDLPGTGPVALTPFLGAIDYDGDGSGNRPEGALSALDLTTLIGCDANTLPMFYATGTFDDPEGKVEFDLDLTARSTSSMFGFVIGRLNGGQGVARRIITMSK